MPARRGVRGVAQDLDRQDPEIQAARDREGAVRTGSKGGFIVNNNESTSPSLARGPSFRLRPSGYGGHVETRGFAALLWTRQMALYPCKMTRHQEIAGTKNRDAAANLQALALLF